MSTIELPEGTVRILGGYHPKPQEFPEGVENFLDHSDLVLLESAGDYKSDPDSFIKNQDTYDIQYKELLQAAKVKGKTLFFPDIHAGEDFWNIRFDLDAPWIEATIGTLVLSAPALRYARGGSVEDQVDHGRRKMLKLLGGWLLLPAVNDITGHFASDFGISARKYAEVANAIEKTHPELNRYVIGVRNLVFAYKILYGLKNIHVNKTDDKKPSASIIVGARHLEGLEEIFSKYKTGKITFRQIEEAFLALRDKYGPDINNFDNIGAFKFDQRDQKWQHELIQIKH